MDTVETMATSYPLCAKTLQLSTVANEYEGREERRKALGLSEPNVLPQTWYERRGYEIFKRQKDMWWEVDPTGKRWPCDGVFMRKDIK